MAGKVGRLLAMRARTLGIAALAALALAACGGGAERAPPDPPAPPPDAPDPPLVRLGDILERADTLLFSSQHARYSLSGGGATLNGAPVEAMACAGGRCVCEDGTVIAVEDLRSPPGFDVRVRSEALGERGGFDTVAVAGEFEATGSVPGVTVTAGPSILSYGFWGEHGFAALELGSGPLSGEVDGTAISGNFTLARAYAVGEVSGTSPAGTGSATWRGIAEASPAGSFARLQGTATVRIADLSQPRVSVAIAVPGHDIDAPGWADMALENGAFSSGTAGSDYLGGNFHGPGHEEAWGVFDTANYLGAFGAKRAP